MLPASSSLAPAAASAPLKLPTLPRPQLQVVLLPVLVGAAINTFFHKQVRFSGCFASTQVCPAAL